MDDVSHTNEYTNKIRGCTGMATNVCERMAREDASLYEEVLASMLLLCCTGAIPRNPNGAASLPLGQLCSMDIKTADTIEARLNELRTKALKAFKMQIIKIYSPVEHPAFIPDSLVSEAVRVTEETASQFLRKAVSGASAITEAPEAFLLVRDAVAAHLLDLQREIEQGRGVSLPPATLKVINERFAVASQRTYQNLENYRPSFSGSKNKGGRPSVWDWESALIHLIAQANSLDGLPMDHGGQAQIEKIISEWFMQTTGNSPAESEIRKRASAVIKAISPAPKAGN